ncbi:MAG TPA: radical SAM protein [Phycisphaerae bacterium]|nr:radical SAM protein [Phycisphaerae bacterium]HUT57360.1 radical SAM protein [Phycisphaerae bacterium]
MTTDGARQHVFGPVPSHRLGRSLGVDLVPPKTCCYDCLYCQLGRTTCKTVERREWVSPDEVMRQLDGRLASRPDFITFSGSGEPTLHSRLGRLIQGVKLRTSIPVAVLTNGALLRWLEVRLDLAAADVVIPSLDAGDDRTFQAVNRPHESIRFEDMLEGLVRFRREYAGRLWLEVFLLARYTSEGPALDRIIDAVRSINPDRVDLNTVSRPPAEDLAVAVPRERLRELAAAFDPPARVVADLPVPDPTGRSAPHCQSVLNLLLRRPCTVEDIAAGLDLHINEVLKCLQQLQDAGRVARTASGGRTFYRAHPANTDA